MNPPGFNIEDCGGLDLGSGVRVLPRGQSSLLKILFEPRSPWLDQPSASSGASSQ
jgi:hypothetical protein